jgi:V/A-type H+-transporting ATPase subunit E
MRIPTLELEAQLIERTVERRNRIISEAEERARRIIQAAERECERIKAESERQVLTIISSELRAIRDRIVGRAIIEGRKMVMLAREEMISRVRMDVEKRLMEIAEGKSGDVEYGEVLVRLIEEAASAIGGEEFIIAANRRDLEYLRGHLEDVEETLKGLLGEVKLELEEEPIEAVGGVVVRSRDGTKIYNNTLEGRLRKAWSRMEAEVAKKLELI